MRTNPGLNPQDGLITKLNRLWASKTDRAWTATTIDALDTHYELAQKITREPGVEDIITQMFGRLAASFHTVSNIQNKKILDIACGSNTSKAPASLFIDTPFGKKNVKNSSKTYTAQFEPWFCRILVELGASPVGVDFGDLEQELFEHYHVDLGRLGALDFLSEHSFDAVQDSRLFGSPEFTAQFPKQADRLKIAQEVQWQEQRLLKPDGIVIHSDASALLRKMK